MARRHHRTDTDELAGACVEVSRRCAEDCARAVVACQKLARLQDPA